MLAYVLGWGAWLLPPVTFKLEQDCKVRLRQYRKKLDDTVRDAGLLFALIPFITTITSLTPPLIRWLGNTGTPAYASPAANIVTIQKQPATCDFPQTQSESFARCAAFSIDFSTQDTGDINRNIFNVFSGQTGVNKEQQLYVDNPENIQVENGALVLRALHRPDSQYQYTSARIDTRGKADFLYGKLVVRAKMPLGSGVWPAIWLLPSESKYANQGVSGYPRHVIDGEIDVAETAGSEPNVLYGVAHTLDYYHRNRDPAYFGTMLVPDSHTAFHDYSLEWTPDSIKISIDDVVYFTYTKKQSADYRTWPFDQPFYLIINVALGGTWVGNIDNNALPATMEIQNIRYYPYIGQE